MRLVVLLPHRVELDTEVAAVGAEGIHGTFTMLPRHLDHVVLLVPGILSYRPADGGGERYVAVDGGVLVKVGSDVRVSTGSAVPGDRLELLEERIVESFEELDERDADTRAALTRIETHVVTELFEFEERA